MDTAGTMAILPPNTPLLAKTPRAAEIFDVTPRQLYKLRRYYPELAQCTVKVGRDVYYDVPKCYAWFGEFLGANIDIEEGQ